MTSKEANMNNNDSRSVFPGNMMNKQGSDFIYHQPIHSTKSPMKVKKVYKTPKTKLIYNNSDKDHSVMKGKHISKSKINTEMESRFTIPNVPENHNISPKHYLRSNKHYLRSHE